MGLFGAFKRKAMGKQDEDFEYDDIKSHVMGMSQQETDPYARQPVERQQRDVPDLPERNLGFDRPPFNERDQFLREPIGPRDTLNRDMPDIVQRLAIIETQLVAIRSQTETINERLKNLEYLINRRY